MDERTLTHEQAAALYDRLGAWQDFGARFEDRAVGDLLDHCELGAADAVFELGCGTGRVAERMLARLPERATYWGADVSTTMVRLARTRLGRFGSRATVERSSGDLRFGPADGGCDRVISTYVLDLLSEADIGRALAEAHRVLRPGGLLGLISLTEGATRAGRVLCKLWQTIHAARPDWVGGCRPVRIAGRLDPDVWSLVHRAQPSTLGFTTEVVVARRLAPAGRHL